MNIQLKIHNGQCSLIPVQMTIMSQLFLVNQINK